MQQSILSLLILVFLLRQDTFSQTIATTGNKTLRSIQIDFTIGAKSDEFLDALSFVKYMGLGKTKKFKIGLGLRFTNYFGRKQEYITAPAILTSRRTDPGVLFSETIEANLDTLLFSSAQTNSLNFSINLQYTFFNKLDLGFNIDALGLSFGANQIGTFQSSIAPSGTSQKQSAKPTAFNYLLVSDNDNGTLNSELFLRYWIKEKSALKIGLGFLFTEYTTQNKLTFNNTRFRNKSAMPVLGYSYSF